MVDARLTLVAGCMFLVATVLTPLLWHLWIHAGSANANFYFAMSVLYSLAQVCNLHMQLRKIYLYSVGHVITCAYSKSMWHIVLVQFR